MTHSEIHDDETCPYCGSISLEKLIKLLQTPGTRFSGSDWKYGWPHKFYVDAVNTDPRIVYACGYKVVDVDGMKVEVPNMVQRRTINYKFYNAHLSFHSIEEISAFSMLSEKFFKIAFDKDNKGVKFKAISDTQMFGHVGNDLNPVFG